MASKASNLESILNKYKQISNVKIDHRLLSMGPLSLNLAVGDAEGVPSGRIIQLVGRQSCGKTTLALDIASQYQRRYPDGGHVLWLDLERSFDSDYYAACGVDFDRFIRLTPPDAETGFDVIEEMIRAGNVKLIVIDSVAMALPSSEKEKNMKDNVKMAAVAGIITRCCQRLVPTLDDYDATLIMINHLRKNFSTLAKEEEVPFGGMMLQYATSVTIHLARIKTENEEQVVRASVKKNKVGSPQTTAEFIIEYGVGVNHKIDVLTLALKYGIIQASGSWYRYNDIRAQGLEKASHEFPIDEIRQLVIERANAYEETAVTGVTERLG